MVVNVEVEDTNVSTRDTTTTAQVQGEEKLCRVAWQVELICNFLSFSIYEEVYLYFMKELHINFIRI